MRRLKVRLRLLRRNLRELRVDEELRREAIAASVQRIFWSAPLLATGNLLAAAGFWLRETPAAGNELLWYNLIITVNLTVSAGSVLMWLFAWKIKRPETSTRVQTFFVYVVAVYVLSVGLTITLIDQLVMTGITPFLICVVIVGTFYYLEPRNSLVLFSLAYLVFRWVLPLVGDNSVNVIHSNQVNGLIVTTLGLALSLLGWLAFRRGILQQRTIEGQQAKLRNLAYQDPLTGLPNRRFLDERIKAEVSMVRGQQTQSALLICDIDHFKDVNDTYGHLGGDDLLRELAELLRKNVRADSTLVRLGGEEFVILAPGATLEEGTRLAERLRELVEGHSFTVDGKEVRITLSIGVSTLFGTEGARDYYHRADRALYQAKALGRNRVAVAVEQLA